MQFVALGEGRGEGFRATTVGHHHIAMRQSDVLREKGASRRTLQTECRGEMYLHEKTARPLGRTRGEFLFDL